MRELWRRSAGEIADLVRTRKVSANEVARGAIDRVNAVNPAVNAIVEWRPEETLARAAEIDAAIARGEDPGLLAGVPITIKVIADQVGYATTNGLRIQRDVIATQNNPVVDNMLAAGAVIVGRTNTPAFSHRWFTNNLLYGDTFNPHDRRLTPGGSSGGAAAAVATGMCHIGHGTDIAGSIRYPAYACGVHGLRPSLGRVAAYNASLPERDIGSQITAVSGPLARSVADIRLGLEVLSRGDPRDTWWVPAPLVGPAAQKRVALCLKPGSLNTSEECCRALRQAASHLERAGWEVEDVSDLPSLDEAAELNIVLWLCYDYAGKLAAAEKEGDPGALAVMRGHQAKGRSLDLAGYGKTLTRRATLIRQWLLFLEKYPVILMPASGELPFENNLDLRDQSSFERVWQAQKPQIGLPLLGLPALTFSTGFEGTSPVGVQIVAGRFREDLCLAAAADIEIATGPRVVVDPKPAG
jgi:amidase